MAVVREMSRRSAHSATGRHFLAGCPFSVENEAPEFFVYLAVERNAAPGSRASCRSMLPRAKGGVVNWGSSSSFFPGKNLIPFDCRQKNGNTRQRLIRGNCVNSQRVKNFKNAWFVGVLSILPFRLPHQFPNKEHCQLVNASPRLKTSFGQTHS